jgi:hypothetical protein
MLFEVFEKITECDNTELFDKTGEHAATLNTEPVSSCTAAAIPVVESAKAAAVEAVTTDGDTAGASLSTETSEETNNTKAETTNHIIDMENPEMMLENVADPTISEETKEAAPGLPTSAQAMMGTVVESAADSAKSDIGGLIPQIESEILKQETDLGHKLEKAEVSLTTAEGATGAAIAPEDVSEDNVDVAMQNMPTAAQKMIGSVVESAIDKAKGEIGSLIPKIEDEINKQENEMEGKLEIAENSLLRQTYEVTFVVHVESQGKADDVIPSLSSEKVEHVLNEAVGPSAEIVGLKTIYINPPK